MDAQRWVNMVFGAKIEGLPRAFGPARGGGGSNSFCLVKSSSWQISGTCRWSVDSLRFIFTLIIIIRFN